MTSVMWSAAGMPRLRDEFATQFDHLAARMPATASAPQDEETMRRLRATGRTLRDSQLYWVTAQMAQLAVAAAGDLPAWTPAQTLPAPRGLLLWDGPLMRASMASVPHQTAFSAPLCGARWATYDHELRVAFVTRADTAEEPLRNDLAHMGMQDMPLIDLGEVALLLTEDADRSTGGVLRVPLRLLATTWLLMSQPTLVEARQVHPPSSGTGRARATADPEVTFVELRTAAAAEPAAETGDAATGRVWHHRWVVRGHWRQQAVGPGRTQRRPVWVPPHVKGPAEAPLRTGPVVHVWRR